ncbi:sugar phosphate isomerase/epimerase family protein [Enterococcus sp. AZ196]|uniref:sugar phosphate isomerase/epimerase family protein n=1 Tax=Enterococcus sp. AZ196 TaxID=2774659 RepID=UPI003D2B9F69
MMDNRLVLNFLVFADRVAEGELQADLLQEAADLGFSKVEIRREYFQKIDEEIPVIQSEATRLKQQLFYSVPDEVYIQGKINPKLEQYLIEAKKMGVKHIKWNIGDFSDELHLDQLKALLSEGVEISIENDQTQTSGTINAIRKYMMAVEKAKAAIGYVYDLGNWRFVGEDEIEAAELLKDYVHYIHVKDVRYENQKPQAAGLDHGEIAWRKVLQILPQEVPVAIEYPTASNAEILEAKGLLEGS